jgi:glycosyltransferase involved in cell wall biosynthesis
MIEENIRVAVLQRVIPSYRKAVFERLGDKKDVILKLFIGEDLAKSKVRSASDLSTLDICKLRTAFINVGKSRVIVNHYDLISELKRFNPDVIICEGESNILSYLKAIWYRKNNSATGLVHWSLGGLPGQPKKSLLIKLVKSFLLKHFDTYIVYSSFGREELVKLGCAPNSIYIALNVSDTNLHLESSKALTLTQDEARVLCGLPPQPTILYAGTLDLDKRLEVLLQAVAGDRVPPCNLVILGEGPLLSELKALAVKLDIKYAFFPGAVSWEEMATYYRAASVFALPGRGGMVISESMAHAVPVIVYEADGTEVDLVQDGITGYRLKCASAEALSAAIKRICVETVDAREMGKEARNLLARRYTSEHMVEAIYSALTRAIELRRKKEITK